ncbi:uncharacterized protein FA14DRAFT_174027 [Meira miltonrushii]|uniref:Uncharacterized protein n=1 Tax=Meira miltonrushii TaxID=1280837 RepID=A0A316VE90_9BASI|nr:uncharacterized protein FA14DRAFT_174027 [Meira miltonrushii]PWN34331.1 hypothetical protein FA14DRAFT_174027 [Meira miltonrushii]
MVIQAIEDALNRSVVTVLDTAPATGPKEHADIKQPKTNDELRQVWPRKYGFQLTGFKKIKPRVIGAVPPECIRQLMLDVIKQIRLDLMERADRTGGAFRHVFLSKTDEEIIDKILSLSKKEMLKDLLRLIDGRGYNWDEFLETYPSVSDSTYCGIYLIGVNWQEETLAHFGYSKNTNLVDGLYVGLTTKSFTARHTSHTREVKSSALLTKLQLLQDIAGLNLNKNFFHYIGLMQTTPHKIEKDPFMRDLERARVRSDCKESAVECFLKTAEAVFIAMFWACQTKDWLNHCLRKCMPFADPIIGLNAVPSFHFGEVANMTAYTQNPRIEEKKDQFRCYSFAQLYEIQESVFKELMRRSDAKRKSDLEQNDEEKEGKSTTENRFKRLAETICAVVIPKRRKVKDESPSI